MNELEIMASKLRDFADRLERMVDPECKSWREENMFFLSRDTLITHNRQLIKQAREAAEEAKKELNDVKEHLANYQAALEARVTHNNELEKKLALSRETTKLKDSQLVTVAHRALKAEEEAKKAEAEVTSLKDRIKRLECRLDKDACNAEMANMRKELEAYQSERDAVNNALAEAKAKAFAAIREEILYGGPEKAVKYTVHAKRGGFNIVIQKGNIGVVFDLPTKDSRTIELLREIAE
jgi:exonuclease VII large subunit